MPKLLQLNIASNNGSTGKIAEQIGLCVQKRGWESFVAYGGSHRPSQNNTIKVGNRLNKIIHYFECRFLDNEGLASRLATYVFIKKMKTIKPDVVHLHNIHDHWINYKMLFNFLNMNDIPVVWTFHDCWAFAGSCYYFDETKCEKWKEQCDNCPLRKRKIDKTKYQYDLKKKLFGARKNMVIVPVSDWIDGLVRQSFLKNSKIEVVKNGIDLKVFKPSVSDLRKRLCIEPHTFIVLGVALPWSKRKGLEDFIELSKNGLFQIILIGISKEQKELLPTSIIAVEKTSNQMELAEYYSVADVFVNATYSDNYPTTNLESIACGTPVITYNTGGSPEAVDKNTGAVVEQGNIEALCEKIIEFKNSKFKETHTLDCRKRAEECFDRNKCFEKYIEIYEQLLK